MRQLFLGIVTALTLTAAQSAQAACPAAGFTAAQKKPIPTKNINQNLFSDAIARAANAARCKAGKALIKDTAPLMKVAATHSAWMARNRKLSHQSTVPGQASFSARARSTGLRYGTAAENVAAYPRFRFGAGAFKIKSASACRFTTQSGQAIRTHSYASLAQAVVTGWLGSPGHRRNLLNRKMDKSGAGIAFDAKADYCGQFFVTQEYMG